MKIDTDESNAETVFKIGHVVSVQGRTVQITVDKMKNGSHLVYQGNLLRNTSVGGYVKIAKGFGEIIAKVDGERVEEDKFASKDYRRNTDKLLRILDVSLIGFLESGKFERGVREMPLLDNECFLLTEEEFELIHNFVSISDTALPVGHLAMEPSQAVKVGIDAIFASHIGIFGNTGSGKSYTLAKLYHELFASVGSSEAFQKNANFVLIDFNGEYVDRKSTKKDNTSSEVIVGPELKQSYVLSTGIRPGDKLPLSSSAINDPTFWTVLLDATEKTQAPFLKRVLASDFWERKLQAPDDLKGIIGDLVLRATKSGDLSMDPHVVFNFLGEIETCLGPDAPDELQQLIDEFQVHLKYHSAQKKFYRSGPTGTTYSDNPGWDSMIRDPIMALPLVFTTLKDLDLIRFKIVIQYYSDIISGFANREHISPLIKRLETQIPTIKKLIKVDDAALLQKPLTVISLRDVNISMRKVIPMILCKQLYDDKKRDDIQNDRYLNLIIDEAHNILSADSARESEAWRDYRLETFEEIVKEGRKFGVFLTIASQRPHDISETIISQLHNYFLHRLINNLDIHAIEKAVSYLDRVSFESLPILPTGTCVVSGVSAQIPVVVKIDKLDPRYEPNSKTMTVAKLWVRPAEPTVGPEE
jgi:DNA helicase HerA-like ATPase